MKSLISPAKSRIAARSVTFLAGLLLPFAAQASEQSSHLRFTSADRGFLWSALIIGLIAIITGGFLWRAVVANSPGSEKMQSVGKAIREGALAYLSRQVRTMLWFVILLAGGLFALFFKVDGWQIALQVALSFVCGVTASYLAGYCGMLVAVDGNMRTANAAKTSYRKSLEVAFRSGSVTGLMTVGLGLTGASTIFLASDHAMRLLVGFGFGASLAALFMRVGGGIFTKAADVGADLVGKVEAGIPEDDPRNPAVIADNVGDNVGDCAGMAADVFESYAVTLVAAIVLGTATATILDERLWMRLVIFALMICGIGILGSIVGIFTVKGDDDLQVDPLKKIRRGFYAATAFAAVGIGALSFFLMGGMAKVWPEIQTSELVSLEQIQRDEYTKVLALRDKLARSSGKQPYQILADDITKDEGVKTLGLSDDETKLAVPTGLAYREEEARAAPDLSGFRRLNFNDADNPVLFYSVRPPKDQAVPPPPDAATFETIRNAFSQYIDGSYQELPMALYDLEVTGSPNPSQPPTKQRVLIGPVPVDAMETQITKASATGLAIVKSGVYPVHIYYNPTTGRIAVAADTIFESERLHRQQFTYYKLAPAEVEKALGQPGSASPNGMPEEHQALFGGVRHTPTQWWRFLLPVLFGILLAFAIEQLTDYYVSTHRRPTQEVAGVSSAGAAPMIIQGFSYALESSVFMVVAIVIALMLPLIIFPPSAYGGSYLLSFYGIALTGLGLLTTTGFVLAMDTFGPISDNAQGVYEMSGEAQGNEYGARAVAQLDAAGNTTKALTKGFAITTAVIAAVALFHSFLEHANLAQIGLRLDYPEIFLGLLIGGAAPFLFSAYSINAVGRAAFQLINEVRRQFRNDPGIMLGTSKPNYASCVSIVTAAAQKELLAPGILAIALPVAVGFGFSIGKPAVNVGGHFFNLAGAEALGGFLAGAILSGQLMAVLLANSGGIWDNAKKIIEDGLYGGKGTAAHKASVICDTVGDPFKDTAGPALNPLIKVMNLVALLLAPTFILPLGDKTLSLITGICVLALAASLYIAKKGSLGEDLKLAAEEAHQIEDPTKPVQANATAKRKITVEEEPVSVPDDDRNQ